MSSCLNPDNVVVNKKSNTAQKINEATTINIDQSYNFDPNDAKYDALFDISDPISSKNIIDCVNAISIAGGGNNEITSGSIMLEIERLIVRCVREDLTCKVNVNDILKHTAMYRIAICVEKIVEERADKFNYYKSNILFNLASIMDIYSINENKETIKLIAFVNYFVDSFTKTSK